MIFHKNKEWSYGSELRQLFLLDGLSRRRGSGSVEYFVSIPPKVVVSVRLGMRCPSKTVAEIREALKAPALSQVVLRSLCQTLRSFR